MGLHNSKVQGLQLQIWLDPGNDVLNTCSYFSSCSVCPLFLGKSSLRDGPRSNKLTPYLATLRQLF